MEGLGDGGAATTRGSDEAGRGGREEREDALLVWVRGTQHAPGEHASDDAPNDLGFALAVVAVEGEERVERAHTGDDDGDVKADLHRPHEGVFCFADVQDASLCCALARALW